MIRTALAASLVLGLLPSPSWAFIHACKSVVTDEMVPCSDQTSEEQVCKPFPDIACYDMLNSLEQMKRSVAGPNQVILQGVGSIQAISVPHCDPGYWLLEIPHTKALVCANDLKDPVP